MTAITILDGGMSREIQRHGGVLRQPEWSAAALVETPEAVRAAHAAFVAAGAEVITANSYAVVPFHLGAERFAAEGAALARRAGHLARAVAGPARVAGCLPPPCGSYRPDLFDAAEAARVWSVLVDGLGPFVDLWLAETISSLAEARGVAASVAGTGKPLWLSFTLRDGPSDSAEDAPALRSGEPAADAARLAAALGAEAILFNCSQPEAMAPAIRAARAAGPLPVGVYANAFRPDDGAANETLHDLRDDIDPDAYLDWAALWVEAGATLVGGCCGIGSDHIAALAAHLRPPSQAATTGA
ncbi:homocysteine S-methyltransferase family protein [Jannaschia ovalis]|uniref:Homocysteine S-methyltransferase family protein n=1 Tax=Jannaschia ovalis TaxID=3038773 RepID=A0ABY8LC57_9RHOB|nr:homocysteine S-methyltransferase family protein [Jannaschia sp. GRR-S6-38]WGH78911.1 homocysteine S-methyltransferase family protein [Jannaschia sp. GRR-S6-38]